MKKEEILKQCINDRKKSFQHVAMNTYKKYSIDLMLKYYILLYNSLGKKQTLSGKSFVFVDEVKNRSMINNLKNTQKVFEEKGQNIQRLCMYEISKDKHVKLGYVTPVLLGITSIGRLIGSGLKGLFTKKEVTYCLMECLMLSFDAYLKEIDHDVREYMMMTDHHFYSSIIAMRETVRCSVLQHGLVMDKYFYYPVRASRFFAWGQRSKELLDNDEKVVVSGTYKFDTLKSFEPNEKKEKILFCISSLDQAVVQKKIDTLYELTQKYHLKLMVKCHPGSMFKKDYWINAYAGKDITFYQEEILDSINFDVAVTENSTIIIDLLVMKKPFILFDDVNGYFEKYIDIIPCGQTMEEIETYLKAIDSFDFDKINREIGREELQGYRCTIFEETGE